MDKLCPILGRPCVGSECFAFYTQKYPFREYYDEVKINQGFWGVINKEVHLIKAMFREQFGCTYLGNKHIKSETIIEDEDRWSTVIKEFNRVTGTRHYRPISEFKEKDE